MGKSNMIKRADGSYSKRGLWDNIRANKGSGKKPTKQMLEQEAKIKAKSKYADGGNVDDFNYDRWRRSLPENLQTESPNYNLRGYWESLNKPDLFNPFEHDLNEDGAYHASSRDPRTGEILKGKLHPTLNLALKDVDDQGNVYTPYMKNRKIYTHTYDSQGNEQYGNGGWLGKYADGGETGEDNKDGGWLDKIDNVLSAPARGATYLLTGKYQDPSDALGIDAKEHPYLKLATDMVLDPTNLLGIGLAGKIGKIAKGAKILRKTDNVLTTAQTGEKIISRANPMAKVINSLNDIPITKLGKGFENPLTKSQIKDLKMLDFRIHKAVELGAKDAKVGTAFINDLIRQNPEQANEIKQAYAKKTNLTNSNFNSTNNNYKLKNSTRSLNSAKTPKANNIVKATSVVQQPVNTTPTVENIVQNQSVNNQYSNPNTLLFQGRNFMDKTGLQPGNYTLDQVNDSLEKRGFPAVTDNRMMYKQGGYVSNNWLEKFQDGGKKDKLAQRFPKQWPTNPFVYKENPFVKINDNRTTNPVTGKPINPNRDLKTGNYDKDIIYRTIQAAKATGVDPYRLLAMGLQETNLGKTDENVFHQIDGDFVSYDFINDEDAYAALDDNQRDHLDRALSAGVKLNEKMNSMKRQGTSADSIQRYNGTGIINTNTEKKYHNETGRGTRYFYGIDVSKEGPINTKKNPVYGKTIVSLEDMLKQNPKIKTMVDTSQFRFEEGGKVPLTAGGEKHLIYRKESPTGNGEGIQGHIMVNHPTMDKGKWDTIDLTEKSGAQTVAQGIAATKKWHAENPEYAEGGVINELKTKLALKPNEQVSDNHIIQLYENLNLGNFNKKISDYLESFKDGNDLKELLNKHKFDEGGIQGRPLVSQRPPQFTPDQPLLYSTDQNQELVSDSLPTRLPDMQPAVPTVVPTPAPAPIATPVVKPLPIETPVKAPVARPKAPVKQPILKTNSGDHIVTPSAIDKRTLPKTVKPIVDSAHKVENKIDSTPVKSNIQKSTVNNLTKSLSQLPSDALQVLEEKSKNPAWKDFKGKYSIYSKENSTLYLFDNNHKLVDKVVAGRGMAKGDFPNTANVHTSAAANRLKATTPAGSYAIWAENVKDLSKGYGNKTYTFGKPNKDNAAMALHDVWGKGEDNAEYQRRMAILNNPKIKEKLFSYGCINIPTGWLDKHDADINVGDSVFVTKEPRTLNLSRR